MNAKRLMICAAMAMAATAAMAQTYNPYQSIGREARVLTLSNGKYEEFFDTDTLEVIGSAILNTKTMRVIGFVVPDTLYSEANLEPELVSRWLSPDPLAAKYPNLSPYNFAGNSPILYVDYDGRDYGVYVDHANKTIIVKATFYTTRNISNDQSQMSMHNYNRAVLAGEYYENLKAQYIVKNDQGESFVYTISFDIDVREPETTVPMAHEKATIDPEGNMFHAGAPGRHVTTLEGNRTGPTIKNIDGEIVKGYTEGITELKQHVYVEGGVEENPKTVRTLDIHEIGHTFTSLVRELHSQSGTFMYSDEHNARGGEPGLNLPGGFIENILGNVGLGNGQVGERKPNAVLHNTGTAPSNFSGGSVQNIQNNNIKK